jgi:hypothetical protein
MENRMSEAIWDEAKLIGIMNQPDKPHFEITYEGGVDPVYYLVYRDDNDKVVQVVKLEMGEVDFNYHEPKYDGPV